MNSKGLLILEGDDFKLLKTDKNTHLTHNLNTKYSIVMFSTNDCNQCKIMRPILNKFIHYNNDIQLIVVDVYDDSSVKLIELSKQTTTPLQYVPLIYFYVNGIPYKKFDGQYTSEDFSLFINNVLNEASKINNIKIDDPEIPPYTIGIPNSSKVCYLTYSNAYEKTNI